MRDNRKITIQKYWYHAKKHKVLGFLMLLFLIAAPATNAITPLYFKRFFDVVTQPGAHAEQLIGVLMIILLLELVQWSFWRGSAFLSTYFQSNVMAHIANDCFEYLHKHSFNYFNNNFVGSLVKRVNHFVRSFEGIADKLSWNLLPLVVNISIIIVVLFNSKKILGVFILIWLVLFIIVNIIFSKFKLKFDIRRSEAETVETRVLADTITNHSNVKLCNGYKREVALFSEVNEKLRKLQIFTWNLDTVFDAVQTLLMIGLEIGILYMGVILWSQGQFTVGDFVLLQSYVLIVVSRIWDFGKVLRNIYRDLADAEEMSEIFDTPHKIIDVKNAQPLIVVQGKIEFQKVNFAYHKSRKILKDFNLTIQSRQKIALVGPSGAGKSTIVKLMLRQHDVTYGSILVDEQKIARITLDSLWQSISFVPQDPILFHRTLMENIRYGKPDATDEEVFSAAKQAHCHQFILDFPDGYDTYVGERGVKLSGGERQRVAIARAILRNTPILILDEATSSLDSQSEMLIQDALDTLMAGKTVVVIAHRLSTIMRMDRIVVIDNGGIVEDGTHKQLLRKKNGIYARLWKLQAGGFIE